MRMDRRTFLTGAAGMGLAVGTDLAGFAKAWAATNQWTPEKGAELRLTRWRRYLPSEEIAFMAITEAFTKATGVKITVVSENWDDIQPKASVAVNVNSGPDMFWGLFSLPFLFPDHAVDVTDVANYLGDKYGGWEGAAPVFGKNGNTWISIPVAVNGNYINYRISAMKKAGFDTFPTTTDGFLELCRALKENNTRAGMPLGRATADANAWLHWALWSHNASLVDENGKIIIDSPETAEALRYVKALYETFLPGTASWLDPTNNAAFTAGECYLTNNGCSIYQNALAQSQVPPGADAAAKEHAAKMAALAEDMDHAVYPIGPAGKPTELQLAFPLVAFRYTKYPQACKAFMAFLMEANQMNPWLESSRGYLTQTLNAYNNNPVWSSDPKIKIFQQATERSLWPGFRGPLDRRAAAALADFIVVDMFSSFCTGRVDEKQAMSTAARSAQRIYR